MKLFSKKTSDKEFPIYEKYPSLQYFDSACVTLKPKEVCDAINNYYNNYPSCSGRSTHFLAEKVDTQIQKSRNDIKKYFNIDKKDEIIFTKNTTEAINLVAHSLKKTLNGKKIITTNKEHNSNYLPWLKLEQDNIASLKVLPYEFQFDYNLLEEECKKDSVGLIAIHYGSNIDGSILDCKKMIDIANKYSIPVLLDAAQITAHKYIDIKKLNPDFLATSFHKMYGPSGMGMLYIKNKHLETMDTFIIGGDTVGDVDNKKYSLLEPPNKFEAGLQDYAGIIGSGAAINFLSKNIKKIENQTQECIDCFFDELNELNKDKKIEILSSQNNNCGIFTFIPKTIDAKQLGIILNEHQICVRSGNFCAHNWFNTYNKDFAIRFSLSYINNKEDVKKVCNILKQYL